MECNIKINMDNAAFEDLEELSNILQQISKHILETEFNDRIKIRESNGNTCGYYEIIGGA